MTIEITDEMVQETIKRSVQKWNESVGPDEPTLTPSDIFSEDVRDYLTAALPIIEKQMRAAWEAEIARAVKRLPWNGVTHGGTMVPLDAVLALLEGGGACCEHSKCPGGSICCCQEGGAE